MRKMHLIWLFYSISVFFTVISASFINPYPRFKSSNDGGDPGDALYLTEYIEKGDIETVNLFETNATCNHYETTFFLPFRLLNLIKVAP